MTEKKTAIDWTGAAHLTEAAVLVDGETMEGYYLGSTIINMPQGPAYAHHFRTDDGGRLAAVGSTILDSQLGGMTLGKMTRIKRIGQAKGKKVVTYETLEHPTMSIAADKCMGRAVID